MPRLYGNYYPAKILRFNDEHIAKICTVPSLRVLRIQESRVTGIGLRKIKPESKLVSLNLAFNDCDNRACEIIGTIKSLTNLELAYTKVTDKGVSLLTELSNLELLDLGGCDLSEESIPYISRLPKLKWAFLTDPKLRKLLKSSRPEINLRD